jgi:hypothetical protein
LRFSTRHEHELAEIKAHAHELHRHVGQSLKRLKRIRLAQDRLLPPALRPASPAVDGSGAGPLIAFVHIPKTAGGAVTTMFSTAYSTGGTVDMGNYVTSPEKSLAKVARPREDWESWQRGGGRVAIGHTPYGVFQQGSLPPDTRYITFLREPVDRVLSHYYRHVHLPGMSDAERATRARRARSLREALVEKRLPQLSNLCTRFLCSHPTWDELPPSALDEAKENLRTFAFVGIQERFEESLVLLQRILGLGPVPYRDRHVSGPGLRPSVEEISDEERTLIEEYNQLDAELYAYGLELFEEALAAAGADIAADVEHLRGAVEDARNEHQAAVLAACVWLDRELPAGGTEPMTSLIARAEAAGLPRAALPEARKELLVSRERGRDGRWTFRRADGGSLTALADAKAWLEGELPVGATEVRKTLKERGQAAGHSPEALNRARKSLGVNNLQDPRGQAVWSRPAKSY